jgi:hypothetical protein
MKQKTQGRGTVDRGEDLLRHRPRCRDIISRDADLVPILPLANLLASCPRARRKSNTFAP